MAAHGVARRKLIADDLISLTGKLGNTGLDKAAGVAYQLNPLSAIDLQTIYRSSWLAKKIVNIPADDMFREWRDWQADGKDIERIEQEEARLQVQKKLAFAMKQARLFGSALLYMSTGDGDLTEPLNVNRIGKGGLRFLNVIPKTRIASTELVDNFQSPYFGMPEFFNISMAEGQIKVHASRAILFVGEAYLDTELMASSNELGDSVLQAILPAIKHVDSIAANIVSLVFEAKVDVVKIPGLMDALLQTDDEDRLIRRFTLAAAQKGLNSVLILDKEEDYLQKNASFAQLPDLLQAFMQLASGAADIPATRLYGQAPQGMNSSGQSDLINYYDRLGSEQANIVTPAITIFDECLIRSGLGARPAGLYYTWGSLWKMNDTDKAKLGDTVATTVKTLNDTGLFPQDALATAAVNTLTEHGVMPGLQEAIAETTTEAPYEIEPDPADNNDPVNDPAKMQDALPRTLYVSRAVLNADEIAAFYEAQGVTTMDPAKMHVTIIHSSVPVDWFKIGQTWQNRMEITEGGARWNALFGPPGREDSLVLMFKSTELEWRNAEFIEGGCVSSYLEFQPHVTIRYKVGSRVKPDAIKPWQGKILLGPEIFEEVV